MYKRVVIKIGTSVLSRTDGHINETILKNIVEQISALKKKGLEIVLVTSGAVSLGRGLLKLSKETENVADKQVFAAIGQVKLMKIYARLFKKQQYLCAQVLVTKEDFRDRGHYQNMLRCFLNLLSNDIIPIVNENDVIAIKELMFTDNDELAGLIAAQLKVDVVIILTSVDGVLDGSPSNSTTKVISEIDLRNIAEIQKHITKEKTSVGRGGMITKLSIAKKLIASGIVVYIANGKKENVLCDIINGYSMGTRFVPLRKASEVKRRLAFSEGLTMGAIVVNKYAGDLLVSKERIMSLLPVGIIKVEGEFKKGDVVEIKNSLNVKIGFGVSTFDSNKVKELIGKKGGKAVIHYDYMFIE